jgi:hypothetical protein
MFQRGGAVQKIGGHVFVGQTGCKLTCIIGVHQKLCRFRRNSFLECHVFRIAHFYDSPYRRLTKRRYPEIG